MHRPLIAATASLSLFCAGVGFTDGGATAQTVTRTQAPGASAAPVRCARFAEESSTAFDPVAKKIRLPWRGDLPNSLVPANHSWEQIKLEDWQTYMAAVLSEIAAGKPNIANKRMTVASDAGWWLSPWMDFTNNGRELIHGLTKERSPDPGDLGPTSPGGLQVWAVGFYNAEGAYGLKQIFADPCDPTVPSAGWTFPNDTMSFKFLFTNAEAAAIPYLSGSPEIEAFIDKPGGGRSKQIVRLLQVDFGVRDGRSPTGWVFGTYVWKGPKKGDGFFDNLEPVGLIWGNDPDVDVTPRDEFAPLKETRLNMSLASHVWRAPGQTWEQRPWPGFQGRLNGPADNLRSSCLSCHALAQWPRSRIGIVPGGATFSLAALNQASARKQLRDNYMRNVVGGKLTLPDEENATTDRDGAVSLDYSLQVEAGLSRLCAACANGILTGKTPTMCKVRRPQGAVITAPTCPAPRSKILFSLEAEALGDEPPPRQ